MKDFIFDDIFICRNLANSQQCLTNWKPALEKKF